MQIEHIQRLMRETHTDGYAEDFVLFVDAVLAAQTDAYNRMSLRDYFAGKALEGMLASSPIVDRSTVDVDVWSVRAYAWADAMLRARETPK